MRSTFRILFYVNRSKESNGMVPVMGRITVNGTIAQFSCQCKVRESIWDTHANRAKGKSLEANLVNTKLDEIRGRISLSYHKIEINGDIITAKKVKQNYMNIGNGLETLLSSIDKDINLFKKRIAKDRSKKTFQKMVIVFRHIKQFLNKEKKVKDIYLAELDEDFIRGFAWYLQYNIGLAQSTVWVYCTYLKKIVIAAYNNGVIKNNPFFRFRISPNIKEREFLCEEEIYSVMKTVTTNKQMEKTRDIFIFSCFTGLSFIDVQNLEAKNITEINNEKWIIGSRKKNSKPYQVKLLDIPLGILKKYSKKNKKIFNIKSYESVRRDLKKIALLSGLKKNLSFHMARHSELLFSLKTSNLQS